MTSHTQNMISNLVDKAFNLASSGWSWWWCQSRVENEAGRLLLTVSIAALVIFWYKWASSASGKGEARPPLPPGPRGLPVVGNLPFLEEDLHLCFAKLAAVYGPIMKIRMGSKFCVVVSSPCLAKEVLRDQDSTFANHSPPLAALAGTYGGQDIVWSPHGPRWRMLRKVLTASLLTSANLDAWYDLRQHEVQRKMKDLYAKAGEPVKISQQVFIVISNTILGLLCGRTLQGKVKTSTVAEFQDVLAEMIDLVGKPNVSDIFPVLARFDVQRIERRTKELLSWFDNIFNFIIEHKQKNEEAGNETPTTTSHQNKNKDLLQIFFELTERRDPKTQLTIIQLKALFMDVVGAGTDTTTTTLEWALTEMMGRPDVMRKAQAELDEVVGLSNMVQESHLLKLPYLDAIVKETLRLHPVVPLLIPHCPSQSCTVGGYTVPKGATVFFNVWAMQRDPKDWENPLAFCPERFVNEGDKCDYRGNQFHYIPFGSGRRICPGIGLAERMMMHVLASLVHCFEWRLPEGAKLDVSEKFGIVLKKNVPLVAIPTPRLLDHELYC